MTGYNYILLSKYRTELMGIALLWIMFFHTRVYIPASNTIGELLILLKDTGGVGVDIFIFLSGIGVFYSLQKTSKNTVHFYAKRFLRIFPAYWLIVAAANIFFFLTKKNHSFSNIWLQFSTLDYWIMGETFLWYIPAIAALYIIYPAFHKYFTKYVHKRLITFFVITVFMPITILLLYITPEQVTWTSMRAPIFFLGAYTGDLILYENTQRSISYILLNILLFILGFALYNGHIIEQNIKIFTWGYYTLLIAYSSAILVTYFLNQIKNNLIFKPLQKILLFLGNHSLEIYLCHVAVYDLSFTLYKEHRLREIMGFNNTTLNFGQYYEYACYTIISILMAVTLKKITLPFNAYFLKLLKTESHGLKINSKTHT